MGAEIDKEEIIKSIDYFNQASKSADEERQAEIKGLVEKLQNAYDSEDIENAGELELYDEIPEDVVVENETDEEETQTVVDISLDGDEEAPEQHAFEPEIVSDDYTESEKPEQAAEETTPADQLEQIKQLEKTLSGINAEENSEEYGNVSIELGSAYHLLAGSENSSKYYGLAITSFRNAS